ncbi:hypothetical protein Tco_0990701 [Tanacetum coccineum]|uniref:Uncharacterized protein n=1 Tax=Tanacetum coccineum TaxID=301880 RepID=A0ABQ5EYV1_9ASTR
MLLLNHDGGVVVWWQWGGDENGEMKVGLGVDVVEVDVGDEVMMLVTWEWWRRRWLLRRDNGGGGGRDGDGVRLC